VGLDWLDRVTSAFLIREPAQVVASYARVRGEPTLEDLGFPQQAALFRRCADALGAAPPVVDASDVRRDPPGLLGQLCSAVGIPFDDAMLSWAPGPRPEDGVWAPHWYAAVEASTGFEPFVAREVDVPAQLRGLRERAQPYYDELAAHRLRAS
jgi:Sulfotransferase domain